MLIALGVGAPCRTSLRLHGRIPQPVCALPQVLVSYDAEMHVEVGPPGPDCVSATIDRFKGLLAAFSDAPWTFQRLCEILLEPKRQYTRLPKVGGTAI